MHKKEYSGSNTNRPSGESYWSSVSLEETDVLKWADMEQSGRTSPNFTHCLAIPCFIYMGQAAPNKPLHSKRERERMQICIGTHILARASNSFIKRQGNGCSSIGDNECQNQQNKWVRAGIVQLLCVSCRRTNDYSVFTTAELQLTSMIHVIFNIDSNASLNVVIIAWFVQQ